MDKIQEIRKYIASCEYDNGSYVFDNLAESLLDSALEIIDQQQKEIKQLHEVIEDRTGDIVHYHEENKSLKEFITGNEYDLTPEFRRHFPKGLLLL